MGRQRKEWRFAMVGALVMLVVAAAAAVGAKGTTTVSVTLTDDQLAVLTDEAERTAVFRGQVDAGGSGIVSATPAQLVQGLIDRTLAPRVAQREATRKQGLVEKVQALSSAECAKLAAQLKVTAADLPCGGGQ